MAVISVEATTVRRCGHDSCGYNFCGAAPVRRQRLFFREGSLGGRSPPSFNHFKKFARRANFLKCCREGVWGFAPPSGISVTRALPPGGGLGGLAPQESPLPVPCLRSGRALPPCLAPNFFSSENFFDRKFFRPKTISTENFFDRKFFRTKNFWTKNFSVEKFFVRIFFVHPWA